jgi:repressor LexA
MVGLTVRQQEVLAFIVEFRDARGFPPTVREIAADFDFAYRGASDHLRALRRKGYIEIDPNVPRGLRVIRGAFVGAAERSFRDVIAALEAPMLAKGFRRVDGVARG